MSVNFAPKTFAEPSEVPLRFLRRRALLRLAHFAFSTFFVPRLWTIALPLRPFQRKPRSL